MKFPIWLIVYSAQYIFTLFQLLAESRQYHGCAATMGG